MPAKERSLKVTRDGQLEFLFVNLGVNDSGIILCLADPSLFHLSEKTKKPHLVLRKYLITKN